MRPVITGRQYAVSSMKHQATEAAVRILEAGGNAFDAAVAGQAVLALVHPGANGFGSDAMILVYDAKTKKVSSVNAGGPAPRLATIDWYKKNHDNKLPDSDGLLVGHGPGRDRCLGDHARALGDHELRAGAAARHRDRRAGLRARRGPRTLHGVARDGEVPDEREAVPTGRPPVRGRRSVQESRRGPAPAQADRGGERRGRDGPAGTAEGRARSLLQRRYRAHHGRVLQRAGCAVSLRGLRRLHGKSRDTGLHELPGLRGLQEPVGQPGSGRAVRPEHARGLRPAHDGAQQRRLHSHLGGSREARDGRPREVSRRHGLRHDSVRGAAEQALRRGAAQADRSGPGLARAPAGQSVQVHEPRRGLRRLPVPRHGRGGGRPRRRYELPGGRRQGSQHGELRAEPPQRVGHEGRHGRSRDHLQLSRRLLLAHGRGSQRARCPASGRVRRCRARW